MDIISLGAATKAAMEESKTRKQTLEVGVKGTHDNVAKRLEALEMAYGNSVKKANDLIIKDAVNIMKAHARLNVVAQSKKYKMENMIFDDLLDLSGIDLTKSKDYSFNATLGSISEGSIVTKTEEVNVNIEKVIVYGEMSYKASPTKINVLGQPNVKVTANNVYSSYTPDKAFDGSNINYNYWIANLGSNAYLTIDFGAGNEKVISKYILWAGGPDSPKSWFFQGSKDGITFEDLNYQSNIIFANDSTVLQNKVVDFVNEKSFRYYRFYSLNNNGSAYYTAVKELELFEAKSSIAENQKLEISRDGGETWFSIDQNKVFVFDDKTPKGSKITMRCVLGKGYTLLNYALTWA